MLCISKILSTKHLWTTIHYILDPCQGETFLAKITIKSINKRTKAEKNNPNEMQQKRKIKECINKNERKEKERNRTWELCLYVYDFYVKSIRFVTLSFYTFCYIFALFKTTAISIHIQKVLCIYRVD